MRTLHANINTRSTAATIGPLPRPPQIETHTHLHTQTNVLHLSSAKIRTRISIPFPITNKTRSNLNTHIHTHKQSLTVVHSHSLTHTHTQTCIVEKQARRLLLPSLSLTLPAVCPPGQVSTNVHVNIMRSTRDTAQYDNSQTHSHTHRRLSHTKRACFVWRASFGCALPLLLLLLRKSATL